jgi:hypothetical protein
MATATAWFSVTTGLSGIRISSSYSAMICGRSVASGTRNARATSAVVKPPTARKVSAICDAGDTEG